MHTPADHVASRHLQTYSSSLHLDLDGFCHLHNTVGGAHFTGNIRTSGLCRPQQSPDWKSKWRQMDGDGDVRFSAKT